MKNQLLEWATTDIRPRGFRAPTASPKRWIWERGNSSLRSRRRTRANALEIEGEAKLAHFRGRARARPGRSDTHSRRAPTRGRPAHRVQRQADLTPAALQPTGSRETHSTRLDAFML